MSTFNMVASMNESTVVSEYIPESKCSDSYQSEADLEKEFIRMLSEQGYEYLQIHTEAELIANLRKKIVPICMMRGLFQIRTCILRHVLHLL